METQQLQISEAIEQNSVKYLLSVLFAESYVLMLKFQSSHWNYTGIDFYAKHLLFERIYTNIYNSLDRIAEALRSIDTMAPASFCEMGYLSKIDCSVSTDPTFKLDRLNVLLTDISIIKQTISNLNAAAQLERNQGVMNICGDIDENIYANAYYLLSSHLKS